MISLSRIATVERFGCTTQRSSALIADRDTFKQVALILLDNALKHSTGNNNVTAKQYGFQVELRAYDFGEGILPKKLQHVFDRFYRGDDVPINPGFGLGSPIAKTLVEAQGGVIIMKSELGNGSSVILYLFRPQHNKHVFIHTPVLH